MSWLTNLFDRRAAYHSSPRLYAKAGKAWDLVISDLRTGMFFRVYNQYSSVPGEERPLLAGQIMNYVLHEEPRNDKAKQYMATNGELIIEKAKALHADEETHEALCYLYAAHITYLHLAMQSGNELAKAHIAELFQRAHELSIAAPDFQEICGSHSMDACLTFLIAYAKNFRERNWRGT